MILSVESRTFGYYYIIDNAKHPLLCYYVPEHPRPYELKQGVTLSHTIPALFMFSIEQSYVYHIR